MVKKNIYVLIIIMLLSLTACNSSTKGKVLNAIKESPITDSYFLYDEINMRWFNFKDQEEDVQEMYLTYLNKVVDFLFEHELKEVKAEEFNNLINTVMIKAIKNDSEYLMHVKFKWPDTHYIKFTIDNKNNKYYEISENNEEFSNIIIGTYYPFYNISLYDFLDHEVK